MISIIRIVLGLVVLALAGVSAHAQGYPTRPVKVIVPFAPGGPTDVFARLIAQKLSETLGQQFYVENQAGAGGNIGMGNAAKSAADGYTVIVVSSSYVVNPSLYARIPYDPDKDFAPVTLAAASPNVLVVHPSESDGILIEGTMETVSKAALCALVLAAAIKVMTDRLRRKPAMSREESLARQ